MSHPFRNWNPLKVLLLGYASYMAIGWIALCLPLCHEAEDVPAIDHLFTAISAVSTTGLATVSTPATYSFYGELVILVLIQLGGIGYMTLGSFILLARKRKLTPERAEIAKLTFALPEGFQLRGFLRNVVLFTLIIESLGAVSLYFEFRSAGVEDCLWQAIFHAVSAFCTAGFSLFPDSLMGFADNFWVNVTIGCLSLSGAIGFLALSDVFWSATGKRECRTLTTRIILHATFWALLFGWVMLFLIEPAYRELPGEQRLMVSGFQAMTSLTTVGFNTTEVGSLAMAPTFLVLLLMILGASPSGTGGGLKSTSVSAAFATVMSTLKGREKVTFWGCEVPRHRLTLAFASVIFYITIFFVGGLLMLLVQDQSFEEVLFETASALGTVGLSRGLTAELTPLGKMFIIALMFIGRLGPITFGLALFSGEVETPDRDDLAI